MKRKLEEFDVCDVKESGSAIVHGVVMELSLVKKSERDDKVKYFNGQISDRKSCVRVVSFETSLQQAMSDSLEKKDAVSQVGCKVRSGCDGGSEVVLGKGTKVEHSPRKFDQARLIVMQKEAPAVEVNDIGGLAVNQQVMVTVKVKKVEPSEKVKNCEGKELVKWDCVIGDLSGCTCVVVWERDTDSMVEQVFYCFEALHICLLVGIVRLKA